jgi:hypothetical protein
MLQYLQLVLQDLQLMLQYLQLVLQDLQLMLQYPVSAARSPVLQDHYIMLQDL